MDFNELPEKFREYWNFLTHEEQREVITCLGQNLKPLKFVLKVPATVNKCGPALAYLTKHKIPFEVKRVGQKIHFIFNKHGLRNDVLIGMNTLA